MQKHNGNLNVITRRSFLDRSFKTSMAVALGTLMDIPLVMKRALAEGSIGLNGKKVLFIWLRGANDGLNSIVPIEDPAYATSRPTLAIPEDPGTNYATTNIDADFAPSGSGSTYGAYPYGVRLGNGFAALHPSLKFLAPVYNAGDLAVIHRVGYPRQSRSHFDSQRYWENGLPNNNVSNEGIFYRTIYESGLANTAPLTGVTIGNSLPLIMRGSEAAMTNLTDPLRYDLLGIPNTTNGNLKASIALNQGNTYPFPNKLNRDMLKLQYQNLTGTLSIFADLTSSFQEAGNTFRDDVVTDGDATWSTANGNEGYYLFPTNSEKNGGWRRTPGGATDFNKYAVPTGLHTFFDRLKAAAIILNKTDTIISGVQMDGFDTHQNQGTLTGSHPDLNRGIGWAMYALRKYFTRYADKATWDNVVVVTLSEFGRTTVENSDLGTDHAEASAMWVAGGSLNGYNQLANRSGVFNCSTGGAVPWLPGPSGSMFGVSGRYLKRASDYRQILGEIIRDHLGATQGQLNRIIPGYAIAGENLLGGGTSSDGTTIRGELGLI
jgi:uncharacterized protein (DUF1501 family)